MVLIKKLILFIIKPLVYIFNLSLKSGVFPEKNKVAKVILLFKAGNRDKLSNYRAISLLPQLSKKMFLYVFLILC